MMRIRKLFSLAVVASLVGLAGPPLATAQDAPAVDPRSDGYYNEGFYEVEVYYDEGYDDRSAEPEAGVERVLGDPGATWGRDPLTNEWEIESVYGEVDYEPQGSFRAATREQLERVIRSRLQGPGEWDYEPLEGEWEYETPAGDEIEYEPRSRFGSYRYGYPYGYRSGYPYNYDYDYGRGSPETGVRRVLTDPYAEWDYEPLGDEWEIESAYGEVDYESEEYFEPASREQLEQAIRSELQQPGEWDYEPLEGEWDYETPTGDKVEYEPRGNF